MKRYLLFSWLEYESHGGMNDFDKDFDSVDDVRLFIKEQVKNYLYECIQVWDTLENKEVHL